MGACSQASSCLVYGFRDRTWRLFRGKKLDFSCDSLPSKCKSSWIFCLLNSGFLLLKVFNDTGQDSFCLGDTRRFVRCCIGSRRKRQHANQCLLSKFLKNIFQMLTPKSSSCDFLDYLLFDRKRWIGWMVKFTFKSLD